MMPMDIACACLLYVAKATSRCRIFGIGEIDVHDFLFLFFMICKQKGGGRHPYMLLSVSFVVKIDGQCVYLLQ